MLCDEKAYPLEKEHSRYIEHVGITESLLHTMGGLMVVILGLIDSNERSFLPLRDTVSNLRLLFWCATPPGRKLTLAPVPKLSLDVSVSIDPKPPA